MGNQRHYSVDPGCPIQEELRRIFVKTAGAGNEIAGAFARARGVELAFIYGSYASGEARASSDIDLMVIGDIGDRDLAPLVAQVERRLHREINYTARTRADVMKRLGHTGDFIHEVFSGPRILLIGRTDDRLLRAS